MKKQPYSKFKVQLQLIVELINCPASKWKFWLLWVIIDESWSHLPLSSNSSLLGKTYLGLSLNRMFCLSFDLCTVLVILGVLNKCCTVKVCVCIGDVYSIEKWFVWRLVWTVVPVSPWHCHLKYFLSFFWRSWHTKCSTCQSLKIHISISESHSAECEKPSAGKSKCSVLILVMQNTLFIAKLQA